MIRPLLSSNGMDAILVIVDQFMKMIRLKATTTNISLEGIAKIKYWKPKGNCPQHTILKQMGRQKG